MADDDARFETDASGARERHPERRLPVRVPVLVARRGAPAAEAVATVVSRDGALLLCRAELEEGEEIELRRPRYGLRAPARVVTAGGVDPETQLAKYGVEFGEARPDFWGLALEGEAEGGV
jgi:hypothetical protein